MSQPTRSESLVQRVRNHFLFENIREGLRLFLSDRLTAVFLGVLVVLVFLAAFGPALAPYEYDTVQRSESGEMLRLEQPSADHLLGTTNRGHDVLSRVLYGAQPTLMTGFLGGLIIVSIGLIIGVTAGYFGGRVDSLLMRITDFAYGVPLIPTAIVVVAYFGIGFWSSILIIGFLLWRGNARVFRSQVLQIRERPFILSAKATGASTPRIIVKHILPNVAPMAIMFFALGIGYSILLQAGLSFIGVSNPLVPSWGIMIRNAYSSGQMTTAWWWSIPPGVMISLTVLSTIMFGRRYEEIALGTDEEATASV